MVSWATLARLGKLALAALTAWPFAFLVLLVANGLVPAPGLEPAGTPPIERLTAVLVAQVLTTLVALAVTGYYLVHAFRSRRLSPGGRLSWLVLLLAPAFQVLLLRPLALALLLVTVERASGFGIFDPARGGDPLLLQHFLGFYGQPAVYLLAASAFLVQGLYGLLFVWGPGAAADRTFP